MLSVKEKGKEELESFKNRVARSYGMGKIEKGDFDCLSEKVEELIEYVKGIEEEE